VSYLNIKYYLTHLPKMICEYLQI